MVVMTMRSGAKRRRSSGFRQFQPHVDADPSFPTEFQVAYDEKNLYVFVRMFDPHPDSIMHALSRRDVRGPSDQIKLLIDSYDDKRSGFEFAVNPDGVKRDFAMSNDGNEDDSWNGIWDVSTSGRFAQAGRRSSVIPLSQLRYARASSHTFGFGVWRDIERYAERYGMAALLADAERDQLAARAPQRAHGHLERAAPRGDAVRRHEERAAHACLTAVRAQPAGHGRRRSQVRRHAERHARRDRESRLRAGRVRSGGLNLTAFETFLPNSARSSSKGRDCTSSR